MESRYRGSLNPEKAAALPQSSGRARTLSASAACVGKSCAAPASVPIATPTASKPDNDPSATASRSRAAQDMPAR
jgi:hypothetical protein